MPFIVINSSNAFDPINLIEFATAAEADAHARELMNAQPQVVVRTAQLINTYSAKVTVTAKPATEVVNDPAN